MKLVIFSDLHYAPERPVNNGSIIERKLTEYSLPIIDKLINIINNEIKPDAVFNLGDLIEDFNDKEIDIINLKFIWNKFKEIDAEFYSLIGNHDLRSMDCREDVERILGYDHSTFSVDLGEYHFVLLGLEVRPNLDRESGGINKAHFVSKEDIEWLEKDLLNNDKPCIIFSHFGLADDEMKGNFWFEANPDHALLGNSNEIKDIIEKDSNVVCVFNGHQHWTKHLSENGINYHVVGSLTEDINNNGVCDGVYFIVELEGKSVKIEERHVKL